MKTDTLNAYVAGIIDGEASVGLYVQKHNSGVGYKVQPQICIVQMDYTGELQNRLTTFCEKNDIDYSIQKRGDRLDFNIQRRESIVQLWDVIGSLLIMKREEMRLLATDIIPNLYEGKHLNQTGFMKMMWRKKQMDNAKADRSSSDRKYDYEYFLNEFDTGP